MRRLLALFTLIGMLGIASGCNHMAGVCDCEAGPVSHWTPPPPVAATELAKPEAIKAMPKGKL